HTHIITCMPSFSYSLLRPHHTSPLFPYTTLFRSSPGTVIFLLVLCLLYLWALRRAQRHLRDNPEEQPVSTYRIAAFFSGIGIVADRKSTRLNSSHVKISYAVFCLKKKIK